MLVRAQALHLKLKLLHLHLIQQLAGHLVSFGLLLLLVLQVAANDVESMILQYEAVAQSTLVANCRHNEILSLGNALTHDLRNLLAQRCLNEADEEHLEHVDKAVLLVDVLESLALHVGFQHLDARSHLIAETLL